MPKVIAGGRGIKKIVVVVDISAFRFLISTNDRDRINQPTPLSFRVELTYTDVYWLADGQTDRQTMGIHAIRVCC